MVEDSQKSRTVYRDKTKLDSMPLNEFLNHAKRDWVHVWFYSGSTKDQIGYMFQNIMKK